MKQFAIEWLTMQQDYLWFLAGLGLVIATVLAIRPLAEQRGLPWAAWVLGGYGAMAIAELVRVAQIVRPPEMGPPNLELDLLHGTIFAVQVWGLWKPAGQRPFWAALLGAVLILGGLRYFYPWTITTAFTLAATAGLAWRARTADEPEVRRLAWALVPGIWLSPIGPASSAAGGWLIKRWSAVLLAGAPREEGLTAYTVGLRRWESTGPWGVWSAATLLATAAAALWLLTRVQGNERQRQELRRFLPWTALWLAAGLTLAAGLGWRTRREYEAAQKMQANLAAKLLTPAALARAFDTFSPTWEDSGQNFKRARLSRDVQEAFLPVRQQLAAIQAELPDDSYALLMLQRGGYRTVAAVAATFVTRPDVIISQDAETDFVPLRRETRFLPPYQESYGLVTQARAPLYFPDGRFLGWLALESGPGEWLARQAQVRVLALTTVGLGLGLALLGLRQRLRNLARDEALREAEVARQANQAKSRFLARVSHELRTPIQSVLGNCEQLQPALPDGPARAQLDALYQHGQLMARLVDDLLDQGAIEAGRFQLNPHPTQVTELVRQTVEELRPRAESKGLAYHVTISTNATEWRLADAARLRQVVLNLVGNAIKFTDEGAIEVSFGPGDAGELCLRVRDSGPGIPADQAARLFQPFARLDATLAKEGTGLGLVITKTLTESMGGGVGLEPQARGACFVARFHLAPAAAPAGATPTAANSLAGRSVLVVDDNPFVRELFFSYLQGLGARCEMAVDGPTALRAAEAQAYDVVVLDLALPGLSGMEVTRRLRARANSGLRIVGVSAHAADADRALALAAGMDVFLTKPVQLRALAAAVEGGRLGEWPENARLEPMFARWQALFRAEAPALSTALATAAAGGDWPLVRSKAHYLKNSADVLQLHALADACRELETAASAGDPQAIQATVAACQAELRPWC